jgi:hypothetical protein
MKRFSDILSPVLFNDDGRHYRQTAVIFGRLPTIFRTSGRTLLDSARNTRLVVFVDGEDRISNRRRDTGVLLNVAVRGSEAAGGGR